MKAARITFVSLIAVGACGVVYVGLTAGLAAFVRYKTGAAPAEQQASAGETPGANTRASATRPTARAVATVEDAAALLRREWTAPRPGLTFPVAFMTGPDSSRKMLAPVPLQPLLSQNEVVAIARV